MYFNVRSTLASGADASVSFTTSIDVNNFDNGAVQVVWSGLNATNGTVRLRASVDGANYQNLTTDPTTMTAATGTQLFNITDAGYEKIQVVYVAASNTAGTVDVYANRKSRR